MFHWMWGNELRNTGFFPYGKEPIHGEPWSLVDSLQLGQLRLPKLRCCCLALVCAHVCLVAQSCPTLGDPMDCSRPGFSVHGILQGRMLEWAANPLSRGSSQPRDQPGSPALQVDSLLSEPPGKPMVPAIPKRRVAINGPDICTRRAPNAQKLPPSELAGTSKPQGHAGPCWAYHV